MQAGVEIVKILDRTTAIAKVYAVSQGVTSATTATVGETNSSTTVTISQFSCGRPEAIVHADLIYPPIGTKNVSPDARALYFMVYKVQHAAIPQIGLHLILGKDRTAEGGDLVRATPPPGSVIPTPPPGPFDSMSMKGAIPRLPATTSIQSQIYDDTCQLAIMPGNFKTQ